MKLCIHPLNVAMIALALPTAALPSSGSAQSPTIHVSLPSAIVGVSYSASFQISCISPCTYKVEPDVSLPDGNPLKVTSDDQGKPAFRFTTSSGTADGAPISATVSAIGADHETVSALVEIPIVDYVIAQPLAAHPTGTKSSPVVLPEIHRGAEYAVKITVSDNASCIPANKITTEGRSPFRYTAFPNLTVDASNIEPGSYRFSLDCGATTAFFAVNVLPSPAGSVARDTAATDPVSARVDASTPSDNPQDPDTGHHKYDGVCDYNFNDCDWTYSAFAGLEQSAISAQDSQTNAFVDLFIRAPQNTRAGSVWLRSRFLGAPTHSDTFNIASAISDPSGTLTSSSISAVGTAIDYNIGYQFDWFQPKKKNPTRGMFTLGLIASIGATTPLSSQSASVAYSMPAYGSDECSQLLQRFNSAAALRGHFSPLPGSGSVTASDATSPTYYCSLQTTDGMGNTLPSPIPIMNIAFVPQDRSSFLLKWGTGLRLINRWHAAETTHCGWPGKDRPSNGDDNKSTDQNTPEMINGECTRSIVDFTIGQDQAITGGFLRQFVLKADSIFPIPKSDAYFFASADLRIDRNQTLPPLLLTPVPIAAGSAGAGSVTIPSSSVWLLPMRQPNRDFYRVGIALNMNSIFTKLFSRK
jgi:hypothetical protein